MLAHEIGQRISQYTEPRLNPILHTARPSSWEDTAVTTNPIFL